MGLDFIVIGAQKAGTTTLWQLLRDHPQLWLPETKEAPYFSHSEVYARGWEAYLRRLEAPAESGVLRGTVTPHYMHGWHDADTRTVAARIARQLPDVRLVALLRDPIERARSQHAMAAARGRERRGAGQALSELLHPEALRAARAWPDDTNSYVVQGEYGRILGEYLSFFEQGALHIEQSANLAREPVQTVRRILRFLEVRSDFEPVAPFQRAFAGGNRERVREEDLRVLLSGVDTATEDQRAAAVEAWLAQHRLDAPGREELWRIVRRYLDAPPERRARERAGMEFTLTKTWNVAPSPPEPLPEDVRGALGAHFAQDATRLGSLTGLPVPWLEPDPAVV
jgi:Sulfotransferase domain